MKKVIKIVKEIAAVEKVWWVGFDLLATREMLINTRTRTMSAIGPTVIKTRLL